MSALRIALAAATLLAGCAAEPLQTAAAPGRLERQKQHEQRVGEDVSAMLNGVDASRQKGARLFRAEPEGRAIAAGAAWQGAHIRAVHIDNSTPCNENARRIVLECNGRRPSR